MNKPLFTLAALATLTALAAMPTRAQEATLFPHEYAAFAPAVMAPADNGDTQRVVITGSRSATREMVKAQLASARADGSLDRGGEASAMPPSPAGLFTRAEVVAELMKAKAEGRFDSSGEHWIGNDHGGRDPSFARAAAKAVQLAQAR
jgi:hypothetical protein